LLIYIIAEISNNGFVAEGMLSRLRLDWVIENITADFQQVVFLCNVSTAMLDPELDQLDVTFKIGATVVQKYTAMAYEQLPARLEALKKFPVLYNDQTKHQKLAHDKIVSKQCFITFHHIVFQTIQFLLS
jgi:hypothetical protein